jgi:hypothetical protein
LTSTLTAQEQRIIVELGENNFQCRDTILLATYPNKLSRSMLEFWNLIKQEQTT